MRTRIHSSLLSMLLPGLLLTAAGCKFSPTIAENPDGNMGFKCFATDNPACPDGLVCCVNMGPSIGTFCGDALLSSRYVNTEGWCQPPPPPSMPQTWLQWNLGNKTTATGSPNDPMLSGADPSNMWGQMWLCPRDDGNMSAPAEIQRRLEPNDTITTAITYNGQPLPLDSVPMNLNSYEICPDKSAPNVPDVDVFKFKVNTQAKVVAEIQYDVTYGDLDAGIFRQAMDDQGNTVPNLVAADVTSVSNACVTNLLQAGTYYVAVRGAPKQAGDYSMATSFWMNRYKIRIYALSPGSTMTVCTGTVGDMH